MFFTKLISSQNFFMQKNFAKKFIPLFFVALFACKNANAPDPYILSLLPEIRQLEKQDHQLCVSLKLNVNGEENLKSQHYWRCRLTFARYRLSTGAATPQQAKRDLEISDLITKISLKVSQTSESLLSKENKKIDDRQHRKCLALGFELYTQDQAKIDDYFSCRKWLINDMQLLPPYNNTDYLNYPNDDYNLGYAIDRRLEESAKKYNEQKAKYPTCVKYNLYSENFRRCTTAQDAARSCSKEIERKRVKREWEEKTTCQKQAYIRFPDDWIKKEDNSNAQEIERMNKQSDFYNQYNLASIGMDRTMFEAEAENKKKEEEKKTAAKKENAKKINSKVGLYRKYELTKLRSTYAIECQKLSAGDIAQYVDGLNKECEAMTNFEVLGE